MKQTILILLTTLFIWSCSNDTVTISKDEYSKLKGDTIKPEYPKIISINDTKYYIYKGSDNHEYMIIHSYKYDNYWHYPDCKLCLNRLMKKDTVYIKN